MRRKGNEMKAINLLIKPASGLCNLRCRYCMPEEGICKLRHDQMLTEDEMIRVVEAAARLGITKLRITGGEPLTKPNILSIFWNTVQGTALKIYDKATEE